MEGHDNLGGVRLVKAALLYADRVRLYSLMSSMLSMVLRQRDFTPKQQLELVEMVAPHITSEKDAEQMLAFLREYKEGFPNRPRWERRVLRKRFPKLLSKHWRSVKETAVSLAKEAKADSIECAVHSGILELHTFEGTDDDRTALEFIADCITTASKSPLLESRLPKTSERDARMLREFVDGVCNAVSDGSTHPLFDTETSELVRESIQKERIAVSEPDIDRGKNSGLAGHLLERLPLFDQASVDEILDIRRKLDKPLTRFRGAIVRFADGIRSASWDRDFHSEAEKVFYRDVGPAVLDIEDAVKSNRLLASILRRFVDKSLVLPAGSLFSLVISKLSSLPEEVALSLGVGISSTAVVYDAYREWQREKQATEQNQLFFYYQAQERLSG